MGAVAKFLGWSVLSLGVAAAGLGIVANVNVNSRLEGKSSPFYAVDAHLYEYPSSDNLYAHYRAMQMENAINSRLDSASPDELRRYLEIDHYEDNFGFYGSQAHKIIRRMSYPYSARSLDILVDILHEKKFGLDERWSAAKNLYKHRMGELRDNTNLLRELTQFITPVDRGEDDTTNNAVISILAESGYKPAVPAIFAAARLDIRYSSVEPFITYETSSTPVYARYVISRYYPSRHAVDVLVETVNNENWNDETGKVRFARLALEAAAKIGMEPETCYQVTAAMENIFKYQRSPHSYIKRTLKEHRCPSRIFEPDWQ